MMKLIESKANKSGEPNIIWRESNQIWLVKIRRRGKTFTANAETIESAIKIRDRVLDYFNNHNEFPTRQQVNAVYKIKNLNEKTEYYCKNCGKTYLFKESGATAKRFIANRHICIKCLHARYKSKKVDISGIHHDSKNQVFRVDLNCKEGLRRTDTLSMKSALRIKRAIEQYSLKNSNKPTTEEARMIAELAKKKGTELNEIIEATKTIS